MVHSQAYSNGTARLLPKAIARAALPLMALVLTVACVPLVHASEAPMLRVTYGVFSQDGTFSGERSESLALERDGDGFAGKLDVEGVDASNLRWSFFEREGDLLYPVEGYRFEPESGLLSFGDSLDPARLEFELFRQGSPQPTLPARASGLSPQAASSIPKTVFYGHGYSVYYGLPGGRATQTYTATTPSGDVLVSYCVNPPKGWVGEQDLHTTSFADFKPGVKNPDMLAMVLYFGPGGPGYDAGMWPDMPSKYFGSSTDTLRERAYCCVHVLASLATFADRKAAFDKCSSDFISWFEKKIEGSVVSEMEQRWAKLSKSLRTLYRESCFMLDPTHLDGKHSDAQELAVAAAELPAGHVELVKKPSSETLVAGNSSYSLKGALYGIFESKAAAAKRNKADAVCTAKTDAEGKAAFADALPAGTYYVSEISPSNGYKLDDSVYAVEVKAGKTVKVNGSKGLAESPRECAFELLLRKADATSGQPRPQGAASLAGAEFKVSFYGGYHDASSLPGSALRTWTFKTSEDGSVKFQEAAKHLVSGDALYKNGEGQTCLPLGTVSVVETKAPRGYRLGNGQGGPQTYVFQVVSDDSAAGGARIKPLNYAEPMTASLTPVAGDTVERGDYRLMKEASTEINSDAPQEQERVAVGGVRFVIINDNDNPVVSPETGALVNKGDRVCTIVTDENGLASTRAGKKANGWDIPAGWTGALAYGTYVVHEEIPDEVQEAFRQKHGCDMIAVADWKVSISREGQCDPVVMVNNKIAQSALKVEKVDAETGEHVPLPASFKLYTAAGELVTYTAHYPVEESIDTWTSNDAGELTLPMLLAGGEYELEEVEAPFGYVRAPERIRFSIDEYRSWDAPLAIEFPDVPVKGIIELCKTDGGSDEALAGAQYAIVAADDIITPDGSVRKQAGDTVAVVVTDAEGAAQSPELYPGTYTVYETKAPEGFALDTEEHAVTVAPEGQDVPVVHVRAGFADAPTTLRVRKVDAGSGEPLAGAKFKVERVAAEEGQADFWELETDGEGNAVLGRIGHGEFRLEETAAPSGYHLSEAGAIAFCVNDQGLIGLKDSPFSDTLDIVVENEPNEIGTSAAVYGGKSAVAEGVVKLVDTVAYKGATPGLEYTVSGSLHRAVTGGNGGVEDAGPVCAEDGTPVTAQAKFVPTASEGMVEVVFSFDAGLVGAGRLVAFEEMRQGDEPFAIHADIADEGQTVELVAAPETPRNPKIATQAADGQDGDSALHPSLNARIVDTVAYSGLEAGRKYVLSGTLHIATEGKRGILTDGGAVRDKSGKPVRAKTIFTARKVEGEAEVVFEFDASELAGKDVVVFEELRYAGGGKGEEALAVHADIAAKSQTVSIAKPSPAAPAPEKLPATGDGLARYWWIAAIAVVAALAVALIVAAQVVRKHRG